MNLPNPIRVTVARGRDDARVPERPAGRRGAARKTQLDRLVVAFGPLPVNGGEPGSPARPAGTERETAP